MGVQQEVERLKEQVHEHENLLRECQALKVSLYLISIITLVVVCTIFLTY